MKRTLLIISLLTIILISGAAKNNQTDSIAYAKQTVQLKELNSKVDSLLKVTDRLSEEKNYFSVALSSQTTIFGVIIAIALAILGGYSVLSIKYEIKKYKSETKSIIKEQDKKIKTIEEKNKTHDTAIYKSLIITYNIIAVIFDKTDKTMCFMYLTSAAVYQMYNGQYKGSIDQLNLSLNIIENPSYYPKIHNEVVEKYTSIDEDFLELINCKDEAVRKIALKIYSKYLEFKEQDPVVEASPKA